MKLSLNRPPWNRRLKKAALVICLHFFSLLGFTTCFASGTPPIITTQPTSQTVLVSASVTFSVIASSGTTMSYQWLKNGNTISGATSSTYTISSVQTNDAAGYSVKVYNASGSTTSGTATLTILVPPGISTQPQSMSVSAGQSATFTVSATGTAPLQYFWRLGSVKISAATNSTLTISNAQFAQAGNYSVVITNAGGSITSSPASLMILPTVTTLAASSVTNSAATLNASVNPQGIAARCYFQFGTSTNYGSVSATNLLAAGTNAAAVAVTISGLTPSALYHYRAVAISAAGTNLAADATFTTLALPGVVTGNATSVTTNSATFNGIVNPLVLGQLLGLVSYYWNYGVTTNYSVSIGLTVIGSSTNGVPVSYQVTGLLPGTLYHFTLVGVGLNVTVAGADMTFTTPFLPPAATTLAASNLTTNSATLNASVNPQGTTANYYFKYGLTTNYGMVTITNNLASDTNADTVAMAITNLLPNTTYHCAIVASTSGGTTVGADSSFLTPAIPPGITQQPSNLTLIAGQSATFSVAAGGNTPLSYQWFFNGAIIASATNASFALASVQSANAGNYLAVVANRAGSATSAVAALTVLVPPTITTQPQSQTIAQGQNVTFSANATGSAPLSCQWFCNNTNISNATNFWWSQTNVQPANANNYWIVITNSAGSATSAIAALTVTLPPTITNQPASQSVVQGQTATFAVGASGTAPFSYQWFFNSATIASATNASLTLASAQPTNGGNYFVVIAGSGGAATSAVAVLTVLVPPAITSQPQSQAVIKNQSVSFSVTATGAAPMAYQWNLNGTNIIGATNATFAIAAAKSTNHGNYVVVITNIAGVVTSVVATLTVYIPPAITTQPQNQTASLGQSATFSVAASGTSPKSYQWILNGVSAASSTNATLTLTNLQTSDAGFYSVVITNIAGSATSTVATLTVTVPPTITIQPQNQMVPQGQNVTFYADAVGTSPFSCQWVCNNTNISDATNFWYSMTNVQPTDATNFWVIIANSAGSTTSVVATLSVLLPPAITNQPQCQTLTLGQMAAFFVGASGTPALGYQWFFNGAAMPGATNAVCSFGALHFANAGSYTVMVTNTAGAATSSPAILVVTNPVVSLATVANAGAGLNGFALQVSIPAGASYVVQASSDLITWTPIATNTAQTADDFFTDFASTNLNWRFYRVMAW